MTTKHATKPSTPNARSTRPSTSRLRTWLWTAVGVSAVVAIAWNARNYPDARVGNPEVTGAPRPVAPLFGFAHWLGLLQVFTSSPSSASSWPLSGVGVVMAPIPCC